MADEEGPTGASAVVLPVEQIADGDEPRDIDEGVNGSSGSSTGAAIFNFTNSILGAGAIALGGAMAKSGGFVSIGLIVFFGFLTKLSLDMVIEISDGVSFEELGTRSFGRAGWTTVVLSKFLYAFGSLVAYLVIIKDTFASALEHLAYGDHDDSRLIGNKDVMAVILSVVILLPLSLLRDMTPLSSLSLISVLAMLGVMGIVMYLFIANPDHLRSHDGTFYEQWLEVRVGVVESFGTFVFTYVSQHICHLAYSSLRPELRTLSTWKTVSSWSIFVSGAVALGIGLAVYATFWEAADSDMFMLYPAWPIIDVAKLLVCMMMLLTFPLPLFTCRDMVIVAASTNWIASSDSALGEGQPVTTTTGEDGEAQNSLEEPLLPVTDDTNEPPIPSVRPLWLLSDTQLTLPYHIAVTVLLWLVTTVLAIVAPSLGAVLDLVGCATGTVIAFVLPGAFSFRQKGFSIEAAAIFTVGGLVGLVGTYFSVVNIIKEF